MPVYSPIMLALCSMLLVTYYASNYAGIIGLGLIVCNSKGGRIRGLGDLASLKCRIL